MSVYDDDPRVVRISDDEFWLPDGAQRWRVLLENGRWNAYDQQWERRHPASGKDTADEAIASIIGEPQ